MAYGTTGNNTPILTSSYRVKFNREEFLHLIIIAKPEFVFHVKRMFFFSFQGFVVYTLSCNMKDFYESSIQILEAIEFSNSSWREG